MGHGAQHQGRAAMHGRAAARVPAAAWQGRTVSQGRPLVVWRYTAAAGLGGHGSISAGTQRSSPSGAHRVGESHNCSPCWAWLASWGTSAHIPWLGTGTRALTCILQHCTITVGRAGLLPLHQHWGLSTAASQCMLKRLYTPSQHHMLQAMQRYVSMCSDGIVSLCCRSSASCGQTWPL